MPQTVDDIAPISPAATTRPDSHFEQAHRAKDEYLVGRAFRDIKVGDRAKLVRTLTSKDIELLAAASGDVNPLHADPDLANQAAFHEVVASGLWGGALVSAVLGTKLPGPGTIYLSQTLRFTRAIRAGDTITASVVVRAKFSARGRVVLDCRVVNQTGETVIEGAAEVIAPKSTVRHQRAALPMM